MTKRRADMTPEERERANARARAWREKNRDKAYAAGERWRARNAEKAKERKRAWARMNRDKVRAAHERWKLKNPDKMREARQRWNQKVAAKRRARNVAPIHADLLRQNAIWAAANAAVPRSLPPDVRDDVLSMVCLAVIEGEIDIADVPRVCGTYVSQHYRQFSKFDTVSLDAPIWHDSGKSLLDMLTTENAVLL